MTGPRIKRNLFLCFIVVSAAALRLYHLDLMEFKKDEAIALDYVVSCLAGNGLPTHGLMSSVGIYNPPVFIYLLLGPGLFAFDPQRVVLFVAALNIASVILCFQFGRRMFNEWTGLFAALLFAFCPWAIIYSRKIWAQDCLPFFSCLFLGGLFHVCSQDRSKWLLPTALVAGLLPGLHFSGLYCPIIFAGTLILFRPRTRKSHWIAAALLLGLIYLPYLPSVRHPNQPGLHLSFANFSFDAFRFAAENSTHFGFPYLLGNSYRQLTAALPVAIAAPLAILGILTVAALCLSFALLALHSWREIAKSVKKGTAATTSNLAPVLCWLWLAVPLAGYLLLSFSKPIYPHYLAILYPAQFWAIAYGCDHLTRVNRARLRFWTGATFLIIAFLNALFVLHVFKFLHVNGGCSGDYGVIYRHKLQASQYISRVCREPGVLPKLASPVDSKLWEYEYLLRFIFSEPTIAGDKRARVREFWIIEETKTAPPNKYLPPADKIVETRQFGPLKILRLQDSRILDR